MTRARVHPKLMFNASSEVAIHFVNAQPSSTLIPVHHHTTVADESEYHAIHVPSIAVLVDCGNVER